MKKFLVRFFIIASILFLVQNSFAQEYKPSAIKKHNEGVIYYDKKQYNNAIDCFLEAVEIDPNFINSYYNLGVLYEYYGNTEKAIASYKNIIKLDAYNSEAAYKVAQLSYKQKNYKVALSYLNLIQKNSPNYQIAEELRKKLSSIIQKEETQYNITMGDSAQIYTQIPSPAGITKDNCGNLYISNFSNNSITVITNNNIKKYFFKGKPLNGPIGLAADKFNNIYVACYNSGKVILLSQDGSYKTILEKLSKPYYLYIDAENNLYISEQGKNSVVKYKLY